MKLFKRKEGRVCIPDRAANGIANGILKSQHWFANTLESLTNKWKQKQQWIFLYAVCLVFGGLSIAAMVNSFETGAKSNRLMPKSIRVPKNIYKEDKAFLITETEFQKVQEYKRTHPNLIKERPGLFDSLILIEQTYYSQKNKTMTEKHSAKFLRQRKMMLVLPVLIIPFLTMGFWALGGGQGLSKNNLADNGKGLNLQLPDANLKDDKNEDKLSFYNEADADSLKRDELLRNDPYYKDSITSRRNIIMSDAENPVSTTPLYGGLNQSPYNTTADANEQRIYQKINEINKQINKPDNGTQANSNLNEPNTNNNSNEQFSNEVDRLQDMMQQINGSPEADPEMQQLNGTLEKILDIQHPDRVKEKLKEKSLKNKEQVFIVTKQSMKDNISLLDTGKSKKDAENRFFGLEKDADSEEQNTVEAVVHQTQTIVNGAVVKMRLLNDIYLNGSLVPKGNFVFGVAELNDERLEININSIRNNNSLFPVKLEVFDMDGLPGIYIPGAISRDVAKQTTDNGLQQLELTSMDPSFKAQAAATGINAAKSLLSKKVKQVKVLVKAGYKVLLRDKSIQQ